MRPQSPAKSFSLSLTLVASLLLAACDPGITIRQPSVSNASSDSANSNLGNLEIKVEPSSLLVGSTWYVPKFKIANRYREAVTITDVQLTGLGVTYTNDVHDPKMYPATIPPKNSAELAAAFHLQTDVKEFFDRPAQLRVT